MNPEVSNTELADDFSPIDSEIIQKGTFSRNLAASILITAAAINSNADNVQPVMEQLEQSAITETATNVQKAPEISVGGDHEYSAPNSFDANDVQTQKIRNAVTEGRELYNNMMIEFGKLNAGEDEVREKLADATLDDASTMLPQSKEPIVAVEQEVTVAQENTSFEPK